MSKRTLAKTLTRLLVHLELRHFEAEALFEPSPSVPHPLIHPSGRESSFFSIANPSSSDQIRYFVLSMGKLYHLLPVNGSMSLEREVTAKRQSPGCGRDLLSGD